MAVGEQTAPASTIPDAKKFLSPSPASLNSRGGQTQMKLWEALNLAADRHNPSAAPKELLNGMARH